MKVELIKLSELENAEYPNNIPTGYVTVRSINDDYFKEPAVGERFDIGSFSTSPVQEIINENTFKTVNSIYHWKVIP